VARPSVSGGFLATLVALLVTVPLVTGATPGLPRPPVPPPGEPTPTVLALDALDAHDAHVPPARPGTSAPAGPLPEVAVAPYVDLTTPPVPSLTAVADATGQSDLVLAFVLAGPGGTCAPTWGATTPMSDPAMRGRIAALRARGGTTTVSSGGALGTYLETACPDARSLSGAYARALDAVGTDHLDVDVETDRGRAVPLDRLADALARLQRERGTRITLTVQVDGAREGLSEDAAALVRAVTAAGVAARVNLMVMNFDHDGAWADAMIGATATVLGQLEALWPGSESAEVRRRTAVTFMLGRNDMDMTTTPADATALVATARRTGLGGVGFWALGRDNGGCPGTTTEADDCSGLTQAPWAFTRIARGFTAPP
jgi:chitinase